MKHFMFVWGGDRGVGEGVNEYVRTLNKVFLCRCSCALIEHHLSSEDILHNAICFLSKYSSSFVSRVQLLPSDMKYHSIFISQKL